MAAAAEFVSEDNKTQGNWKRWYGKQGYLIPGDQARLPAYATLSTSNKVWVNRKKEELNVDPRALQLAASDARRAACWYEKSAPVNFDLKITDGHEHLVSLYMLDLNNNYPSAKVELIDADTGTVLDAREVRKYTSGRYLTWRVKGHVHIRVSLVGESKYAGAWGVFFQ